MTFARQTFDLIYDFSSHEILVENVTHNKNWGKCKKCINKMIKKPWKPMYGKYIDIYINTLSIIYFIYFIVFQIHIFRNININS